MDNAKLSEQVSNLLGAAKEMMLMESHLTAHGIEMVFASNDVRAEVRILPKVYTAGMVVVDAVNDLTITVEVIKFRLGTDANGTASNAKISEDRIELPYSVWFEEGEYR
jgi:hypothetical protein